jgi:hypothetical protein|nr:MAG TPA: hypothetical protein [Caudoviricetes sp.]
MTDNEKRAHDLALSHYQNVLSDLVLDSWTSTNESNELDVYTAYKKLYDELLELFNRDYPSTG